MTLRIGEIPYLNSVLFYHGLREADDVELVPLVPRQLSGAAVESAIDAGPVPLVTCWDIEDRYQPLSDFCIATTDKARSILLFSKRPFAELAGADIGVTAETSTSVRLMKVLLAQYWRVRPREFVRLDWPNNDAFLLIGDEALIHRKGVKDYPHCADLGEVWRAWLGLPFVFAQWVARRDLDPGARETIARRLADSLESGWPRVDELVAGKAHELGMTIAEMREYLEGFRFRATDEEYRSIARFRELDAAVNKSPDAPSTV